MGGLHRDRMRYLVWLACLSVAISAVFGVEIWFSIPIIVVMVWVYLDTE